MGSTLAHLWNKAGTFVIQDVLSTSQDSAQMAVELMGAGRAMPRQQDMAAADVWMLSVPDAQIAAVAQALASHAAAAATPPAVVFHCSGALGSEVLAPLQACGWHLASAHCILSFASVHAAVQQFPGTPCALEGDACARVTLQAAFSAIQARCFDIRAKDKLLYHAAAVFATNFLPVLQSVAEDLWRNTGVPADVVVHLRSTLLHNAVANITARGPQGALTGPAARGDLEAIAIQGHAVTAWDAQAGAAYAALSQLALALAHINTRDALPPRIR